MGRNTLACWNKCISGPESLLWNTVWLPIHPSIPTLRVSTPVITRGGAGDLRSARYSLFSKREDIGPYNSNSARWECWRRDSYRGFRGAEETTSSVGAIRRGSGAALLSWILQVEEEGKGFAGPWAAWMIWQKQRPIWRRVSNFFDWGRVWAAGIEYVEGFGARRSWWHMPQIFRPQPFKIGIPSAPKEN